MSADQPGMMVILSAPSGAGKTTLARRLLAEEPKALFSVSVTTRAPRGVERDGVDYTFVDRGRFTDMIEKGELLEWAEVHGNLYGTPRRFADEANDHGRIVIFDIDVQGGRQIKRQHPQAIAVFVLPPSLAELERRLRMRATDDEQVVQRRLRAASTEILEGLAAYDFILINDSLEQAFEELRSLLRLARFGHQASEDDPLAAYRRTAPAIERWVQERENRERLAR